jgi:hypothetical protein
MGNKFKFNGAVLWVIGVMVASVALVVYLFVSDAPKTQPKIKLSYFSNEQEIAKTVIDALAEETAQSQNYWIGIEPLKPELIEVALQLKAELEKKTTFQKIIVDQELGLSEEVLKKVNPTDIIFLKENVAQLGEILFKLEAEKINYLVITASIYSNSILLLNPIQKIKHLQAIKPITFSLAYMPVKVEDEGKMLFSCDTEDRSGGKDWACLIVSKARVVRRKIKIDNDKSWTGLMDLTTERDYIILLNKKL